MVVLLHFQRQLAAPESSRFLLDGFEQQPGNTAGCLWSGEALSGNHRWCHPVAEPVEKSWRVMMS
jgi:hypothetical protein